MFFFLNISNISFWENTSEVSPSCQFVNQDPSLCTFFLDSCPYQKPPSKWQSSQPVYPQHRTSPAQPPTGSSSCFVWAAVIKTQLEAEIQAIKSERNPAGSWVSSDTWLPLLNGFRIPIAITNARECTPCEVTSFHLYPRWLIRQQSSWSAWSHSHHGLNPLVEPPDPSQNFLPQVNPFNFEYHSGVSWISIFPV